MLSRLQASNGDESSFDGQSQSELRRLFSLVLSVSKCDSCKKQVEFQIKVHPSSEESSKNLTKRNRLTSFVERTNTNSCIVFRGSFMIENELEAGDKFKDILFLWNADPKTWCFSGFRVVREAGTVMLGRLRWLWGYFQGVAALLRSHNRYFAWYFNPELRSTFNSKT